LNRDQQAYDDWLTNQPSSEPLFHSYEEVENASRESFYNDKYISPFTLAYDNIDELRCGSCSKPVGYLLYDDNFPPSGSFVEFWQMDDDGEYLLCFDCYEEITKEIGG